MRVWDEIVGGTRKALYDMPFDKAFNTSRGRELCHATGYEVLFNGEWWNEYEDRDGETHLGR